jgi:prepilin-type N-terminal cleavage/methylation domain-containing protein
MKRSGRPQQHGYSLIEIMMVMVITVLTAGIAIPTMANTIADIKLRSAASSFAGLLQQARLAAVQKNTTYTTAFNLPSGKGAYAEVLVPVASGGGTYSTGEPMVQFGGNVDQDSAPTGSNPPKLDAAGGPLGWTATSGNVSFNSRGLACDSSATPCGTNVNYIFYFSDTRAFTNKGWAAVSITAAGRIKTWSWSGTQWID